MNVSHGFAQFVQYARERDGITFVEALELLSENIRIRGLYCLRLASGSAIIVWSGLSQLAAGILADAINGGHLHLRPCDPARYALEEPLPGGGVSDGNTPGWLPCLLIADAAGDDWAVEISVEGDACVPAAL